MAAMIADNILCLTVDTRDPSYPPVMGNEHPRNVTLWGSAPVTKGVIIIILSYYNFEKRHMQAVSDVFSVY